MSLSDSVVISCPNCREKNRVIVYRSINIGGNSSLRNQLLDGKINIFNCKHCGYSSSINTMFMYHDTRRKICIWYYPSDYLDDDDFYNGFSIEGFSITDKLNQKLLPEYFLKPHVVFNMDELIHYVIFREKLYSLHTHGEEISNYYNDSDDEYF